MLHRSQRMFAVFLGVGLVGLMCSSVSAAMIENPSFETDGFVGYDNPTITGWTTVGSGYVSTLPRRQVAPNPSWVGSEYYFHTEGQYGLDMYTMWGTTLEYNSSISVRQSIDLTGAENLIFDVRFGFSSPYGSTLWQNIVNGQVLIDGETKWIQTDEGLYLDQVIDLSSYTGIHTLELRLQAYDTQNLAWYDSQHISWDNLRITGEPSPVPGPSSLPLLFVLTMCLALYRPVRGLIAAR